MRRLLLLAVALMTAGTAQAQSVQTAYAGGSPVVLTIPVTASVGGRCGFATAPSGTYDQANFDQIGLSAQFDFALNCTGPSRVAIVSANGGLLSSTAVEPGYTNKSDYNVTLNLVGNDGSTAQGTCAASALVNGSSCAFVGTATTTQGLRLAAAAVNQSGSYIRISAPKQTGSTVLVAGSYSDSLTVTVSPSL